MQNLFNKILENKEKVLNKFNENVNIDSIIIENNGQVFSHFYKEDSLHEMRSLSKVLIALAYGIILERKMLSLDTFVYPIIKDLVDIKNTNNLEKIKKWQIKHLLTYTAGYESQMFSESYIKDLNLKNSLNYVVNFDLVYSPGERYVYNNAETFLLSVCFSEMFNENITDFIKREIFEPLNIVNFRWDNYGKYCPGGTGLYISHADLFKIGQLILNKGTFLGKNLISEEYIQKMCSTQIQTPYAVKPGRVLPKLGVGYVMHISRDGYFYKDGKNGQYLIFNFEKNLLISILSSETDMTSVTEILRNLI